MTRRRGAALVAFVAACLVPVGARAYVGPGAGIAFTTVASLLTTAVLVVLLSASWPFRQLYLRLTRKRPPRPPHASRVVIVGLDGLDPALVRRFMDEGRLSALRRLAERGTFRELATTFPAISPVAWSSFATGVNPGKHGIYDFVARDARNYRATPSSAQVLPPRRQLSIGRYRIALGAPRLRLLRRSIPFWKILDRYRVPCAILRVPITFPPEPFGGVLLSAMSVPDLQGTQGSYSHFTSGPVSEGGRSVQLEVRDGRTAAALEGPDNPLRPGRRLRAPFSLEVETARSRATLRLGRHEVALELGRSSAWTPVEFRLGLGLRIRGICKFRLLEVSPHVRLYVTPINIDPARPVLPISHPRIFSVFLSKLIGRFATLGLAEDTSALSDGVLDEGGFLEQVESIHDERERMFFEMLERTPRGVLACVFDGTDRVQHMFMRQLEGDPTRPNASAIADTYARMDQMVARVLERVPIDDPRNLVIVLSDHGFKSFRRGVNLNAWLHQNGYLHLEPGRPASDEWLEGVDWSKTRAFALGLGGVFLNLRGREARGVVEPGDEARALVAELARGLSGLVDPALGSAAIREAYPADRIYRGPYGERAPDLIIGYAEGWRASWAGARGVVDQTIFEDNHKAWSGDHCIDPALVPGVLIANRALGAADRQPSIEDLAPTLLDAFGVPVPPHMDGISLLPA